ncbi:MAG TPA: formate/nitrite transporter family protein [Terriglobales bacterium]|nr:formate/nitrite transporter family protein [Terriglobales bacterium]
MQAQEHGQELELKSTRRSAPEILENVISNGREELARSTKALALSGLAGGFAMGLTGLSVAVVRAVLGHSPGAEFAAQLFYPAGFIAVIIGRAQLFTENTLYPVVLVLEDRRCIFNTLRLWAVVFVCNVLGALVFSLITERTPALSPKAAQELVILGVGAVAGTSTFFFWSGVIGGWLIALVAWMVSASHWTIGQIAVVWLLTFVVGVGGFSHCIATSGEILAAVVSQNLSVAMYLRWLLFATFGNIIGGVTIVTLLNYGQVRAGENE